jgi:outer membrane protein assembly factor BamB
VQTPGAVENGTKAVIAASFSAQNREEQGVKRLLFSRISFLIAASLLLGAVNAHTQSLETRWTKEFSSEIEWYVRTSLGILMVKSGNGLTALNARDGRQLWTLPQVKGSGPAHGAEDIAYYRGKNLREVPDMGILLLNRMSLPNDSDGHLMGLNLETGERLWNQPQIDDLKTVMPLQSGPDVILVSTHLDRKMLARNVILTAGRLPAVYYPYHLRFRRLNPLTGETRWTIEHPPTFYTSVQAIFIIGDRLFLNHSNFVLTCVALATGKQLWEEEVKGLGSFPALPVQEAVVPDGPVIYGQKTVRAVEASSNKIIWEIKNLGKVTGIDVCDGIVVAIGNDHLAAVDAKSGVERWRIKTHGHATNTQWDRPTDTIIYVDGKGLHTVERTTGKALVNTKLDAPGHNVCHPITIRLAGPEVVVLIAKDKLFAYNFKTGKHLLTAGRLVGFYPARALTEEPDPENDVNLHLADQAESGTNDRDSTRAGSLISASAQQALAESRSAVARRLDAYETQSEEGARKVWWIDEKTNLVAGFGVAGTQHDVSRQLRMIFSVDNNTIRGDVITEK